MKPSQEPGRDARGPKPVDLHVGGRVRMRRKNLGLSQSDLGQALGLTFQQVQKYERGTNRVSASKLYETAQALHVPLSYFFEGCSSEAEAGAQDPGDEESVHGLLMTTEGVELARLFPRIHSSHLRQSVLDLVRALGDEA